jgi:hypothetical protein
MSKRSEALAQRLEKGAWALAAFAGGLSESQWKTRVSPSDARTVGVIVHHVAWQYEIEIQLAGLLASGKPIAGVKWSDVHAINANHAKEYAGATKQQALELLKRNSTMAAEFIRKLTDEQLDTAQPVSLAGEAPLTAQFFIEDHALRHSYWHLEKIREVLAQPSKVAAA